MDKGRPASLQGYPELPKIKYAHISDLCVDVQPKLCPASTRMNTKTRLSLKRPQVSFLYIKKLICTRPWSLFESIIQSYRTEETHPAGPHV